MAIVPGRRSFSGLPVSFPRKLLRDVPTTTGRPSATISSSRRRSSRLWSSVLPKPMPGSSQTRSSATPAADGEREPLLEERLHVRDDVVVARIVLHGARLAEHVHQAAVHAGVGHQTRELRLEAEGRHVVHDRRARVDRGAGDLDLRRVDRDARAHRGGALDDRQHAADLLVGRDGLRPGTRRLAADVEDVRALVEQLAAVRHGRVRGEELAAVRERVRRHVDDPHDQHAASVSSGRWSAGWWTA